MLAEREHAGARTLAEAEAQKPLRQARFAGAVGKHPAAGVVGGNDPRETRDVEHAGRVVLRRQSDCNARLSVRSAIALSAAATLRLPVIVSTKQANSALSRRSRRYLSLPCTLQR